MGCTSDKRANSLKQELIDGGLWNLDTVNSSKWMAIKASMSEDFRPELTFANETIASFDKVGLESEAELSTLKEAMKKVLEDKKLTKKEREVYNTSSEYFRENKSKKVSEAIGKPIQLMKLSMLPFDLIAGIIDNAVTSTGKELPFVVKIFEKNKVSISNMILGNGPKGSLSNQLAQSYNSAIKTEDSHYSPNNVVNVSVDFKSNVYDEVTGRLIGEYRELHKAIEAGSIIVAEAGKNINEKYDKNELAIEENLVKIGYTRNDVLVPSENKKYENYIGVWTKDGVDYEFKDGRPTFQEVQDIASGKKQINYTGSTTTTSEPTPIDQKSTNPILNANVKDSVKNSGHFQKDINMGAVSTQFIGEGAKEGVVSSTNAYRDAWGDKANTGNYTSDDTIMVSGSGPWRGVTSTDINRKFESFYKPLLSKAIEAGSKIVVGNAKGIDQLVVNHLKANGYNVSFNNSKNHWEANKKESEINNENDDYDNRPEVKTIIEVDLAQAKKIVSRKLEKDDDPLSEFSFAKRTVVRLTEINSRLSLPAAGIRRLAGLVGVQPEEINDDALNLLSAIEDYVKFDQNEILEGYASYSADKKIEADSKRSEINKRREMALNNILRKLFSIVLVPSVNVISENGTLDKSKSRPSIVIVGFNPDDSETKGSSDSGLGLTEEDEILMEEDLNRENAMMGVLDEMFDGDNEGHSNTLFTRKYLDHVASMIDTFETVLSEDKKNKGSNFNFYQREEEGSQTKAEYTKRLNADGTYTTSIDILYHDGDTTATASEMYLHEATHQFVNGAFELNPSLKKDTERLRQKIIKEGLLDYSIFLTNVESPTDVEIARAKEKFDYIFSSQSSTEEFLAYATSNSLLYDALSKIDLTSKSHKQLYEESGKESIVDMFMAMVKDLKSTLSEAISGLSNDRKGSEIISHTINAISEYNLKMQALGENPRLMRRLGFTGFAEASGLDTYILHADELIGKLEAIDIKINPKLDRAIRTVGSITYSFYKDNLKKGTVGALESIAKIKSVEKILNTRLVQNVGEQLFGRTKFKHGTAQFYQMYRQAKLLTDSYVNTSKGEIRRSLNDKSLFHPLNEVEAQVFNNAIIATGMHEFMANKTGENMTRESIDRQLVSLRAKMHGIISQTEVSHLEALGKHTLDGKAHIENQQINAYNVLRNATHPDLEINKDTLKLAKEFASMYALSQTSDSDIGKIKDMLSNPEFKDDMLKTSLYYSKLIKSLEITYMSKDSSYFPVPHNFTHKSTTGRSKVLSLIHHSDYSKGKSLYGNVEIHEELEILGEKFYKVSYIEPSNQFDEGMLNSVAFQTKGLSIRSALKRVYMEKKDDSDFDPMIENSNQFVSKYMGSYSWRKHLNSSGDYTGSSMTMPIKGENGALKDIVIPFSKTDESMIMAKDNYSVETLSSTLSRALDIMTAKNNNAKAIMLLNQFHKENKDNKKYDFIELSKFKTGKEWNKLSPTIKSMIADLSDEEEALMIPSKLWELIVGSDQSSLSNLKIMGKEVFKSFTSKRNVKFLEDIVASIFQKNKTALILFNPDVFSGNMISNMHIAYSHGVPPTTFMPQFKTLWSELDEFEKLSKRKAYLLIQRGMGEDVTSELKMVKGRLRNSGFAPLVNDGQFTSFTDDLEADNETAIDTIIEKHIAKDVKDEKVIREIFTEAYTRFQASTRDGGPLEDYIREVKMEYRRKNRVSPMKLPHQLRKISDIIYGSKGTSAHKIGEKLTIYGDIIPKRMILDKMVSDYQKQHRTSIPDVKMQEFLNELDEKFINYSYNTSGAQKWMEKVGGLWFLKYFLRHGKGYVDIAKRNPMSVIKQQMIPYAFGIDIADPTDTHLDHTVYENVIKNRWKGDELLEQIGEAIAPNIFMPFDISQGTFFKDAL